MKNLYPESPEWLYQKTILLAKTGSHSYGTATASSDQDFKGIVIPPANYFLGLASFEGYDKSGGKNFKNKAGDIDITLIHIIKFIRDAANGVPSNLELLFLDSEDYLILTDEGKSLISIREKLLSKLIIKKIGGYDKSQAQKMKNLNSHGSCRRDLVEEFGYDTKFYMHRVRILEMAIEILKTGTFKTKRANADYLLSLRKGLHTFEEALENLTVLEEILPSVARNSSLPENPDYDFIDNWLTELIKQTL